MEVETLESALKIAQFEHVLSR